MFVKILQSETLFFSASLKKVLIRIPFSLIVWHTLEERPDSAPSFNIPNFTAMIRNYIQGFNFTSNSFHFELANCTFCLSKADEERNKHEKWCNWCFHGWKFLPKNDTPGMFDVQKLTEMKAKVLLVVVDKNRRTVSHTGMDFIKAQKK